MNPFVLSTAEGSYFAVKGKPACTEPNGHRRACTQPHAEQEHCHHLCESPAKASGLSFPAQAHACATSSSACHHFLLEKFLTQLSLIHSPLNLYFHSSRVIMRQLRKTVTRAAVRVTLAVIDLANNYSGFFIGGKKVYKLHKKKNKIAVEDKVRCTGFYNRTESRVLI